jgi:hypothetical protein
VLPQEGTGVFVETKQATQINRVGKALYVSIVRKNSVGILRSFG